MTPTATIHAPSLAEAGVWVSRSSDPLLSVIWQRTTIDHESGCHIWNGPVDQYGYARAKIGRKLTSIHRLVYERLVGPIPAGYHLHHHCFNKRCVNASHCEPLTPADHNHLYHPFSLLTHCKHGHVFDAATTYYRADRGRDCRRCNARRAKEYRQRKRLEASA